MTPNGSDFERRLTRMENLLMDFMEAVATDHRQLLTAQVLLTDEVRKTSAEVRQTSATVAALGVRVDQVEGQVEALVKIVDGIIRDRGNRSNNE